MVGRRIFNVAGTFEEISELVDAAEEEHAYRVKAESFMIHAKARKRVNLPYGSYVKVARDQNHRYIQARKHTDTIAYRLAPPIKLPTGW